jgi:hypothetical protein
LKKPNFASHCFFAPFFGVSGNANVSCSALWLVFEESYSVIFTYKCAALKNEYIIWDEIITNSTYKSGTNGPDLEDDIEI